MNINLQKMNKGEIWDGALKGKGQVRILAPCRGETHPEALHRFYSPVFPWKGMRLTVHTHLAPFLGPVRCCCCMQMDPFTTESVKKQLMLERFQEEVSQVSLAPRH